MATPTPPPNPGEKLFAFILSFFSNRKAEEYGFTAAIAASDEEAAQRKIQNMIAASVKEYNPSAHTMIIGNFTTVKNGNQYTEFFTKHMPQDDLRSEGLSIWTHDDDLGCEQYETITEYMNHETQEDEYPPNLDRVMVDLMNADAGNGFYTADMDAITTWANLESGQPNTEQEIKAKINALLDQLNIIKAPIPTDFRIFYGQKCALSEYVEGYEQLPPDIHPNDKTKAIKADFEAPDDAPYYPINYYAATWEELISQMPASETAWTPLLTDQRGMDVAWIARSSEEEREEQAEFEASRKRFYDRIQSEYMAGSMHPRITNMFDRDHQAIFTAAEEIPTLLDLGKEHLQNEHPSTWTRSSGLGRELIIHRAASKFLPDPGADADCSYMQSANYEALAEKIVEEVAADTGYHPLNDEDDTDFYDQVISEISYELHREDYRIYCDLLQTELEFAIESIKEEIAKAKAS